MKKCFSLCRNQQIFVLNQFYLRMPQGLPKETPRTSRQARVWLRIPGYTQPKVVFPYAVFP